MFSLTAAQGRAKPTSASSLPMCHQVTAPAEKSERLLYSRQASSDMFLLVSVAVCLTWKFVTRAVLHRATHFFFLLKTKKGQAPGASAHKFIVLALGTSLVTAVALMQIYKVNTYSARKAYTQ